MDVSRVWVLVLVALSGATAPAAAREQTPVPGMEQDPPGDDMAADAPGADPPGAAAVARAARGAQVRFETRRVRWFPRAVGAGGSGPCDERIGRFCSWYGEGDWVPVPEAPEIAALRTALLAEMDSLQRAAPGEGWILGQRVWYRAEAGDWEAALGVARGCAPPHPPWWCEALTGLALHGLDRIQEAERAFDRALVAMDPERAWRWRVPERALDGAGRRLMDHLRSASPDSAQQVIDRLWALADPLHLVPGNDRRSAHFARWTVATLRDGARTPYGLRWARDLEELVVRNGWELGWERDADPRLTGPDVVIGRNHPEGRDYLPPGGALAAPHASAPADHVARSARPASVHAPAYAPVVLPMTSQVAVFPRGRTFEVVATHDLPADTTRRAREGRPRPWMAPPGNGTPGSGQDVGGLHLLDARSGMLVAAIRSSGASGVSRLEAPVGPYLLSVESWSPDRRLAGRHREGLDVPATLEDVLVLSDLLLVHAPAAVGGGATEPALPSDLASVSPRALLRPVAGVGEPFGVFFEVSGLGFRTETLTFELSVERMDRSLLQRLGGLIGRGRPDRPLALSWREPAPDRPGILSREVRLHLPDIQPGRYEIRLVARGQGRDPVQSTRVLEIVSAHAPGEALHVDPSSPPF